MQKKTDPKEIYVTKLTSYMMQNQQEQGQNIHN